MARLRAVMIPMPDASLLAMTRRVVGRSARGIMNSARFRGMLLVSTVVPMSQSCVVLRMLATSSSINLSTTLLAAEWIALDLRLMRLARLTSVWLRGMAISTVSMRLPLVILQVMLACVRRTFTMVGPIQRLLATTMPASFTSLDLYIFVFAVQCPVIDSIGRSVVFIGNC